MPPETVVFVTVLLSVLTIANAISCYDDTKSGDTECPSNYCFVSVSADEEQIEIKKCADVVPENKKHEVNTWIRSGDNFVYVCDTPTCNRIMPEGIRLEELMKGKLICQANEKGIILSHYGGTLTSCFGATRYRCGYTKNIESNEIWQHCMQNPNEEQLLNTNKCVKTETEYQYFCNTSLCNNAHVCDQLELGKPSPFDLPPPAPTPEPGQSSGHEQASGQGLNDTAFPRMTSTPKNTGSRSNLPTIAMSLLVVGIYCTV